MSKKQETKKNRTVRAAIPLKSPLSESLANSLEETYVLMPGIYALTVSRAASSVFITYNEASLSKEEIIRKITDLGLEIAAYKEETLFEDHHTSQRLRHNCHTMFVRFIFALAFSAAMLAGESYSFSGFTFSVVSLLTWFTSGWHFHKGALASLRAKKTDSSVLVSLSCLAIFVHGIVITLFPDMSSIYKPHWHDIGLILAFVNFGLWVELKYKVNSVDALDKMFSKLPIIATRIGDKGEEVISVEEVKIGDILLIKPGVQIPADGHVTKGLSSVDESLLTGEAIPASKAPGSNVYAGTFNQSGWFEFRASRIGRETTIMRIAQAVQESRYGKNSAERIADKISRWFVPSVIFLSLVAGLIWMLAAWDYAMAFGVFASMLAVACPCAIGLAIPFAVRVGFRRAESLGVQIRNTEILDIVKTSDTVIFDKTGTITDGTLELKEIHPQGITEDEFLKYVSLAEEKSEHPLALAVRRMAEKKEIYPHGVLAFTAYPGRGVKVTCEDGEIMAGSLRWFELERIAMPLGIKQQLMGISDSLLMLAKNGEFLGYASFGGRIRHNAAAVVKELKEMNIEPVLASGDSSKAVETTAKETGIDIFHFGVFPDDKRNIIRRYKALGKSTVMVGDGFNDAPALASSDIGISLRSGADLAAEASDVTLMHDDLKSVVDTILILKRIRITIKQNMAWAFIFNGIMVFLSAGILYPICGFIAQPQWSIAAVAFATFSIAVNSLLLKRMRL